MFLEKCTLTEVFCIRLSSQIYLWGMAILTVGQFKSTHGAAAQARKTIATLVAATVLSTGIGTAVGVMKGDYFTPAQVYSISQVPHERTEKARIHILGSLRRTHDMHSAKKEASYIMAKRVNSLVAALFQICKQLQCTIGQGHCGNAIR